MAKNSHILQFFFLVLLFPTVFGLLVGEKIIRDLELNSIFFKNDAENWSINNTNATLSVTYCSRYFLGVYQSENGVTELQRTYTDLLAHNSLTITFEVWMFGSWDTSATMPIFFEVWDSLTSRAQQQRIIKNGYNISPQSSLSCNGNSVALLRKVSMNIVSPHTASTLILKIITNIPNIGDPTMSANRYYGIRNLQVLLSNISSSGSECVFPSSEQFATESCRCPSNQYYYSSYYLDENEEEVWSSGCSTCSQICEQCSYYSSCLSCSSNYYWDGTQCKNCYSSCATCGESSEYDCVTCQPNKYLYWSGQCLNNCSGLFIPRNFSDIDHCDPPCSNGTDYYYHNETCNETCLYPFYSIDDQNGTRHCYFRCEQEPSRPYLYQNDTCLSACSYPFQNLTQGLETYCNCNPPYYFYWNGSCLPTCNFPLETIANSSIRLCQYPCQNSTDHLYWNGSCLPSCDSPFKVKADQSSHLYCDTDCYYPQYLFLNQTCASTCPSPIPIEYNYGVQLCQDACTNSSWYYNPLNRTCQAHCSDPWEIKYSGFYNACTLYIPTLSDEELKNLESLASLGNAAGTAASIGLTANNVISPGDPGSISAGVLAKMLQLAKFMNITYTLKLEYLFQIHNTSSTPFGLGPKMNDETRQRFPNQTIPYKFTKYKVSSSFVVNFWDSAISLAIFCGILLFASLIELAASFFQAKYFPVSVVQLVRFALQNYLLTQFYNYLGDIALYSCLELRSNKLDSSFGNLSFLCCLFFITIAVCVVYLHIHILQTYQQIRKKITDGSIKTSELDSFQKDHGGLQVFFGSFRDLTFISQGYLLIFITRSILVNLCLTILYQYPLAQAIIMMLLTFLLMIYLFIFRPFKSIVNLLQQVTFELTLFAFNISLVGLAVLDLQTGDFTNLRESLSQVILNCSLFFNFVPPFFLALKIIVFAREFYLLRKQKKALVSKRVQRRDLSFSKQQLRKPPQNRDVLDQFYDSSYETMAARNFETTFDLKRETDDHGPSQKHLQKPRNSLHSNQSLRKTSQRLFRPRICLKIPQLPFSTLENQGS